MISQLFSECQDSIEFALSLIFKLLVFHGKIFLAHETALAKFHDCHSGALHDYKSQDRTYKKTFSFPELRSSWPAPRIESSGRFQSVVATDWSDGNTIKMITGRNRKRMAEGILFSVCRIFGEKTIREGIVRD